MLCGENCSYHKLKPLNVYIFNASIIDRVGLMLVFITLSLACDGTTTALCWSVWALQLLPEWEPSHARRWSAWSRQTAFKSGRSLRAPDCFWQGACFFPHREILTEQSSPNSFWTCYFCCFCCADFMFWKQQKCLFLNYQVKKKWKRIACRNQKSTR